MTAMAQKKVVVCGENKKYNEKLLSVLWTLKKKDKDKYKTKMCIYGIWIIEDEKKNNNNACCDKAIEVRWKSMSYFDSARERSRETGKEKDRTRTKARARDKKSIE